MEHVVYERSLRELGLFSLNTQQGPHNSLTPPLSKLRRWSQAEVHVRRRGSAHKLKQMSLDIGERKKSIAR